MTEIFEGQVESIAFGGKGIVRHDGLVVFIPYTAVGDRIRYQLIRGKKNFADGKLLEVFVPSQERTQPKCPYYGSCGGCQLQHVTYSEQLQYKRQWIEDAVIRQGGLSNVVIEAIVRAADPWCYRRRISLSLREENGFFKAGYIGVDQKTLIEVKQCQIFAKADDLVIPAVQQMANKLVCKDRTDAKVTILKNEEDRYILHFHFKVMPENADGIFKAVLAKSHFIKGILATSIKQTLEYGQIESLVNLEGFNFRFSPRAFVQNHPEQSLNIYRSIVLHSQNIIKGNVLDLYCGIGVSSLLLAGRGFSVTGIELNKDAIEFAKKNAKSNQITNARFIRQAVEKELLIHLKREKPVLVVMNPPREGLLPMVIEALITHPPEYLIYISCMPSTLARDLKLLCHMLYDVTTVEGYDMFPETSHVETLVVLKRR